MKVWSSLYTFFGRVVFRLWHWETWHWLVKYIPILPAWGWYCLRSGSPWFFTASNPCLTFGGFDGENKKEMYERLPADAYPKTRYIRAACPFASVEELLRSSAFGFPIAVKPAIGRMGLMFRKLDSPEELRRYHKKMPVDYMLQEFITYPLEVSVFYYRLPSQSRGTITGFVRKEHLAVTGDGTSTLWQLMHNDPNVRFRLEEMKLKHAGNLHNVIPEAQVYTLSHALNLSRGGKLISLEHEKDEKLLGVIDDISKRAGFYFGRYDIKCSSLDDLRNGRNFSILEFNGSGAEPHHVYGNGNSLIQALSVLLHHWEILFRISAQNHKNGIAYWRFSRGLRHLWQAKKHLRILRDLESEAEAAAIGASAPVASARPKTLSPSLQRMPVAANPAEDTYGH